MASLILLSCHILNHHLSVLYNLMLEFHKIFRVKSSGSKPTYLYLMITVQISDVIKAYNKVIFRSAQQTPELIEHPKPRVSYLNLFLEFSSKHHSEGTKRTLSNKRISAMFNNSTKEFREWFLFRCVCLLHLQLLYRNRPLSSSVWGLAEI